MHEWIRPVGGTPETGRWHLELVASPSGGRRAYCVNYFEPGETLEERPFERPPDIEDRCPACDVAYVRIPRIRSRRAAGEQAIGQRSRIEAGVSAQRDDSPEADRTLDIRRQALRERLRAEWIAGAEEEWRRRAGRSMTTEELERVLSGYPGDL